MADQHRNKLQWLPPQAQKKQAKETLPPHIESVLQEGLGQVTERTMLDRTALNSPTVTWDWVNTTQTDTAPLKDAPTITATEGEDGVKRFGISGQQTMALASTNTKIHAETVDGPTQKEHDSSQLKQTMLAMPNFSLSRTPSNPRPSGQQTHATPQFHSSLAPPLESTEAADTCDELVAAGEGTGLLTKRYRPGDLRPSEDKEPDATVVLDQYDLDEIASGRSARHTPIRPPQHTLALEAPRSPLRDETPVPQFKDEGTALQRVEWSVFSDRELLTALLEGMVATPQEASSLSAQLFLRYGSLHDVAKASLTELAAFPSLGLGQARALLSAFVLAQRLHTRKV